VLNSFFEPDIDLEPQSIDRLTQSIERALTQTPELRQVWVTGEVSSANFHPSGIYFTLKDPVGQAALPSVIWKSRIPDLETKPQVGTQVCAFGSIAVYAPHGKYQFQVQQVLPLGEGLQALRERKLRQRLTGEGLFDLDRKQALPYHPRTIAVVTSPTAAAWGDIQRTILSRYPGLLVLLSPATVQGETAPQAIVRAIDRVLLDARAQVIILARGGGATEDLSCFNDEAVVRAIAECPIPIVTGIGHERDESLADLAADARASTPTAAAALVVPRLADFIADRAVLAARLNGALARVLLERQHRLAQLRTRLERIRPDRQLATERDRLTQLRHRLHRAIDSHLQIATQERLRLNQRLQALDPRAVLQRGYAVVRQQNGAIVRESDRLRLGEELEIQLDRGRIGVRVLEIEYGKEQGKTASRRLEL
jgi:exodeoxyribonuclease VII large subunit